MHLDCIGILLPTFFFFFFERYKIIVSLFLFQLPLRQNRSKFLDIAHALRRIFHFRPSNQVTQTTSFLGILQAFVSFFFAILFTIVILMYISYLLCYTWDILYSKYHVLNECTTIFKRCSVSHYLGLNKRISFHNT